MTHLHEELNSLRKGRYRLFRLLFRPSVLHPFGAIPVLLPDQT